MNKKEILVSITMFLLVLAFIFIHEYGHYYVAKQNDLNPEMHFFSVSDNTKNNSIFTKGFTYVTHKYPKDDLTERKILVAGLTFELFFLIIISAIALIITFKKKDWLLFMFVGVMFVIIIGLSIEWNIFFQVQGSDLYYLLGGLE